MNHNFVDVYIRKIPFEINNSEVLPLARKLEIESCSNEKAKQQKYYVWKLLEYGMHHSLGLNIKDIKFNKNNTKWECVEFKFSLSHSNDIVAVAIAKKDVGIDVEKIDLQRFAKLPLNRILTEEECASFGGNTEQLNAIWTVKEAIFKKGYSESFNPCKVNTLNEGYLTKVLNVENKKYYITVATNDITYIKFNLGDELDFNR